MKKDIINPKVEGVAIAIAEEMLENNEMGYQVYLLNLREDIIEGIIVTSSGFGVDQVSGEQVKTSTLRRGIELLLPNEGARIEPIMESVFGLTNQFMVSFWVNDTLFDKKYVFEPGTIVPEKMEIIPLLGRKGVLIK